MDISEFADRLCSALTDRGISPEDAKAYIENLKKDLSPDDVASATEKEISESADMCAELIRKNKKSVENSADDALPSAEENKLANKEEKETEFAEAGPESYDSLNDTEENYFSKEIIFESEPDTVDTESRGDDCDVRPTPRGIAMLALVTVIASPLIIIIAALFLAPFIIMLAAETALTLLFICLLAGEAAVGAAASLTGIIYGIIKLFSVSSIGIYEIGFGIIIAGVTMICGILLYNASVRLMPWLFRKTAELFKYAFSKVKPYIREYKRRCEKL